MSAVSEAPTVAELRYPAELPITERRPELLRAIESHQVVIVAGETGSGKSTQLPKMCLELGRGRDGLIGHTQPRRLAARSVAERVAEELGSKVGDTVGYAVRFTDRVGPRTQVKLMTDGILLAEIQRDRDLRRYDTIIVDEAHERSLNIDFLLGYLTRLLPRRPDLEVIITSATIDTERFAEHFDAPVVEVTGRTYPVEIRYRPFGRDESDRRDQIDAVCDAVTELWTEDAHDTLVFLSGEREIHDTADALRRLDLPNTEILPLYARLGAAEQHRIFEPHTTRRVVLATNVAETSLTVPGIRSVVDAGTARISRHSRRLKVQRLPIEPVSQASADQRAGRCGRIAPGVCIRLFDEDEFLERPDFTEPEILRTSLASVILQMAALGIGEIDDFPFVDPPDRRAVTDGILLLEELGAFDPRTTDPHHRLTKLGRKLARLPIDPRMGRMILEADREGCVREVITIAAGMTIQDPRERPAEHRQAADELHRRFHTNGSDFLTLLELWRYLRREQRRRSGNAFRRMCKQEHLHFLRVREWQDLDRQLRKVTSDLGVKVSSAPDDADAVHRSILAGLLSHMGMRDGEGSEYRGARDARFRVVRDSAMGGANPRWVMVAELVETNRLWGRMAAPIQPEWAERLGGHLVKRSYGDPVWDADRGSAVTDERVTLYGLPIVTGRTVGFGKVDPELARDLFIQHALVEGDADLPHAVLEENRARLDELRHLTDRARRSDLVVADDVLFDFYDERVGDDVVSLGHFDRWWTQIQRSDPGLLRFDPAREREDLVDQIDVDAFPDTWVEGDLSLGLTYEFDPTSPTDGVMVHVPVDVLARLDPAPFGWQVPGFRVDLVEALLRSLPKDVRRQLVPVRDWAEHFVAHHGPDEGPITEALATAIRADTGARVFDTDWRLSQVPRNLRMTFAVLDADDHVVGAGKDLRRLQDRLAEQARESVTSAFDDVEASGLTSWTIGELPREVRTTRDGLEVIGYPALVEEGETVGVRVLTDLGSQASHMRAGTRRLLLLQMSEPRRVLAKALPNRTSLALAGHARGRLTRLLDDCLGAAVDDLVDRAGGPAWDAAGFTDLDDAVRGEVIEVAAAIADALAEVLERSAAVEERLAALTAPALDEAVVDIRAQLARYAGPGFAVTFGPQHLRHLPRYLAAVEHRVEKLPGNIERDRQRMREVQALEAEVAAAGDPPELRWFVEELRVGLFAQHLGTATKVSAKKIRARLHDE